MSSDAFEYARVFDLPLPEIMVDADQAAIEAHHNTPEKIARRAAREAIERAQSVKRERLWAERARIEREQASETIVKWRAGESVHLPYAARNDENSGALVRLVGNIVETSQGAEVPASDARHLFENVRRVRESGIAWIPAQTVHVGMFTLDRIEADGTLYVGCHGNKWPEIEHYAVARVLNATTARHVRAPDGLLTSAPYARRS
jgi:hypothetical protein